MSITNKLDINIRSQVLGTVGLSSVTSLINQQQTTDLTSVATDSVYTATTAISGGSVDIDLIGSLTDPLGIAVTFAKVMAVFIVNNGANAMTIGGANNIPMLGSGDVMNLAAGAYFQYTDEAGIAVTAGTGDLITVAGTNTDEFEIVVIGSST